MAGYKRRAFSLAGRGRRSAGLPAHGKNAARRTPGLEAALADHNDTLISSLEPEIDARTAVVPVAGPAALFVAKAHKLYERLDDMGAGRTHRLKPKDASDVFRLMQAEPAEHVGQRLREIASDEMAGASVRQGVQRLQILFGRQSFPPGSTSPCRRSRERYPNSGFVPYPGPTWLP